MEKILEMKGITKRFPGVTALDNVSFELLKGEVHALIGENGAGKSTLMKVLLGLCRQDAGEIFYKGKKVDYHNPHDALVSGISMIHQEISLVPTLSVAENVWMGRENDFTAGGIIRYKKMRQATKELLGNLGISLRPETIVNQLSVANMQLVELVRAVSYNSDIIIMDEPTSALTDVEIKILYKIVNDLSAQGTTVIFISHKLEEIFKICRRVTVMRDGRNIVTKDTDKISNDELISLIAGRKVQDIYTKDQFEKGRVILEVSRLCSQGVFEDVNFEVHAGEILGFCGLVGAGRSEIMRAIFGIDSYDSGDIYVDGICMDNKNNPAIAIKLGIGMVTEDRMRMGALHKLSIMHNMSIPSLPRLTNRLGFVRTEKEKAECNDMIHDLSVNMVSLFNSIGSLSGGNQQKVIIGRWLMTGPKILILDEPTRGIDVGAKSEIYKLINALAKEGIAIIMVSSEMPEILGMSDRIAVVRNGEIVHTTVNKDVDADQLLSFAFGMKKEQTA